MAAKVKIQDITDAGFRAEQFGTPADWEAESAGYLSRLIARAEQWAIGRFGAGYSVVPADSATHERLRAAELCWVSGHLWKRRAAFVDSNAMASRENLVHANREAYERQANRAFECADDHMALALGITAAGTGAALAHVETGPYAAGGA
ncbi:hypothetical protein LJR143_001692 [Pseudoxanthomonas sp. LjRoot143]|uniref:hypothetical protein n=1 Tax=Pseudoxanthomonas sp. LjRoot143 TaxID=3342266 RepID=UPI003ECDC55B